MCVLCAHQNALLILQTTTTGCRIVVDEYEAEVADTIRIPIRVEGGVDVGSLDLNITFDPTLLSAKSALDGAFDSTTINPEVDSGVVKVIAYQAVNPGLNGNLRLQRSPLRRLGLERARLTLRL